MAAGPANNFGHLLGSTVGSYRVEGLVGFGGMGAVYKVKDPEGRPCALKLLHSAVSDTTLIRRFLRESSLAQTMTDPHLVPVLDTGTFEDSPFLVMPLLEGKDVARLLKEVGPLHPATAVRIAVQASRGLSALHASGIVHRDVKPSNLFLATQPDGKVLVRICDFGIAKSLSLEEQEKLTQTGTSLGSPHYMSPEQARSPKSVDARSDVYSLAVTLYKMLSGQVPHDDKGGLGQYLLALVAKEPTPIQDRAAWVDPGLARVLHRALRRLRDDRTGSVGALAQELEPFLEGRDELTVELLRPVDAATKAWVAPRFDADSSSIDLSSTGTMPSRPRRSQRSSLEALIDRKLGGRWRVIRPVGRGGMGAVLEVVSPEGVRAAAKIIDRRHVGEGEQTFERFLREAKAARSIDSPHVVRTLEVGHDAELDSPFIVMELLEGVDLGSILKARAPLEAAPLVRAFIQAGRGIAAAHEQGIVHRDVKPANLFLHQEGPSGRVTVKVCDFGIAKRAPVEGESEQAAHELTQTGGMLGSPMYMSPEQAVNAKKVDLRTDIWSLSIALYEGLSGKRVWAGCSSLGEILVAICTQPVPSLRKMAPWVDPALADVVQRGLAPKAEGRWASVEEMLAALEPFAGGTTELSLDELRTVPAELRPAVLLPSDPPPDPRSLVERGTTAGSSQAISVKSAPSRMQRGLLAVGAAVLLAAFAGFAAFRRPEQPAAAAPRAEAPKPEPARHSARLTVRPEGATVLVDGVAAPLVGTSITLEGEAGKQFVVSVSYEGVTKEAKVVLSSEGQAVPDVVELEKPAQAAAPAQSASVAPARAQPAARPAGGPKDPAAAAAPAAPAPARPEPAKPSYIDTW